MEIGEKVNLSPLSYFIKHIFSADEAFDGTYHTNVVVTHEGSCTYIPPGIFKSSCKIDITWYESDLIQRELCLKRAQSLV